MEVTGMYTREKTGIRSAVLQPVLLFILIMFIPCAIAQGIPFQEDYTAIDLAAKSVLMLEIYDRSNKPFATGSGFVAFDNQTIITNYHVMEDAYSIKAYSDDGDCYMINSVIAADEDKDIAILGFESPVDIQPLSLAENSEILRGQPVVAIGSPVGIKNTVSTGNISTVLSDDTITMIQFTAPISHGSSGGALFNAEGQVIGITTSSLEAGQNLNYAVDINEILLLYANRPDNQMSFTEYFTGDVTPPSNTISPTATPAPDTTTTKPTPELPSKISDLTAKQIGPNSVKLEWKENSKGSFTYYTRFEFVQEAVFGNTITTTGTSYVFENLLPGYEYAFTVSTSEFDANAPSVKLEMQEADKFTSRNYKAISAIMYYCNAGESFWDAKRTKITKFTLEDMKKAGVTRDYALVLTFNISKASQDSTIDTLYNIVTPKGKLVVFAGNAKIDKKGYRNIRLYVNINQMILECVQFNEKGTYTLKQYFNGQLAAKTSFKVN
jgi:hypothetical protein